MTKEIENKLYELKANNQRRAFIKLLAKTCNISLVEAMHWLEVW